MSVGARTPVVSASHDAGEAGTSGAESRLGGAPRVADGMPGSLAARPPGSAIPPAGAARFVVPAAIGRGRPKIAYGSRVDAQAAAAYILQRRGVRLREYQCEDTWRWHLTSDLSGGW